MVNIDGTAFARSVDAYCNVHGVSKEELMQKTGISTANLSQWRTGTNNPSMKKIRAFESFSKISVENLMKAMQLNPNSTSTTTKESQANVISVPTNEQNRLDTLAQEIRIKTTLLEESYKAQANFIAAIERILGKTISIPDSPVQGTDIFKYLADMAEAQENVIKHIDSFLQAASKQEKERFLRQYSEIKHSFDDQMNRLTSIEHGL